MRTLALLLLAGRLSAQVTSFNGTPDPVGVPLNSPRFHADIEAALTQYFPNLREDVGPGIESLKSAIKAEPEPQKRGALLALYSTLRTAGSKLDGLPAKIEKRIGE